MERKREPEFRYEGFGFPVLLIDVPMVQIRGCWTPDVDYNKVSTLVLESLAHKPARLVGDEIRFIRNSLSMTLQKFAERLGVTHPAVMKWESAGDRPTGMTWATEKDIRLEVLRSLSPRKPATFLKAYEELSRVKPSSPQEPTAIELGAMLMSNRRRTISKRAAV